MPELPQPGQPAEPQPEYRASRRTVLVTAAAAMGLVVAGEVSGTFDKLFKGRERLGEPLEPRVSMEAYEAKKETSLLRTGSWETMEGAEVTPAGLRLTPTGRSIVNKREDDKIEPNPPLSLFGPRLQVAGDFTVSAHVQSEGPASIQLYGQVPERYDDFRFEHARLECTTDGNKLRVRMWDGTSQEPSVHEFPATGKASDRQVDIRRKGKDVVFLVDGKEVGTAPERGLFNTGECWFGLNSETGAALVRDLSVKPENGGTVQIFNASTLKVERPLADGLQARASASGITLGAAFNLNAAVSDPSYAQLHLGGEVGSITPENALKPQDTQPKEGVFTLGEAEASVQLAERHGLAIHGHSPIYDQALPKWMHSLPYKTEADKQRVREVMTTHIKTVVGHFKGRIASWDIINEAIEGFDDEVGFRDNIWYRALGEEYIPLALQAAAEADPNAKLYINDYGLETNSARAEFMLHLADWLQKRDPPTPLHGIGIQGHVYELPRDKIRPKTLRQLVSKINAMNLEVHLSELDITGKNPGDQQDQYLDVVDTLVTQAAENRRRYGESRIRLTFWGLTDRYGSTSGVNPSTQTLHHGDALPWTADYRPKSLRRRIANSLAGR